MPLDAGEIASGGEVRDVDGRLIVVTAGGAPITGGGGGTASTVALDAPTLAALETVDVANLLNPHPVSVATALDISDRTARLLGHVTVDNASLPVTGTFWQATQPVSGTLALDAATLAALETIQVGNFPATQPVSDNGGSITVDSPQLPAALVGGRLDVNVGASVTQSNREEPTANRTPVAIYAEAVAGSAADALVTLIKNTAGTTAAGATSIAPTAGKTLRITYMMIQAVATGTVLNNVRVRLRMNLTGAAVLASPIYFTGRSNVITATTAANAGHYPAFEGAPFAGFDVPSGAAFALSQFAAANSYTLDVSLHGYEFTP